MPVYAKDSGLESLGNKIIKKDHELLGMLKIAYIFRDEAPVSNGKATAGMAYRADDRNRTLHGVDAIIEIAKDIWDEATDEFKDALMDHELSHIMIRLDDDGQPMMDDKTGRVKITMRPHDIEEFEDVLERHGPYHKALRSFLEAFARKKEASKKKKRETQENGDPDDVAM
jgi:hypothetical protein